MIHAHYNEDTFEVLGWYIEGKHHNIPTPTIPITTTLLETSSKLPDVNFINMNLMQFEVHDFRTDEDFARAVSNKAKSYLSSTDWYVTRFIETSVAIPQDISTLRAEARAKVVDNV